MTAIAEQAAVDFVRQREVAHALRAFLPESAVLFEQEDVKPYECDGLSAYRQVPMVVALPENEQQVQRILKTCYDRRVPVVARGAGTGLSGGALPLGNGVLLSLARLMRILEIDPPSRTARVQPGVRNLAISEAAAPYGLYYAPDPSSQIACSIGGNVAENAGGMHCLKYGLTVHNIMKLRVDHHRGRTARNRRRRPRRGGLRSAGADDRLRRHARRRHRNHGASCCRNRNARSAYWPRSTT